MDFIIRTQYLENYNTENPGEGEDVFKFKFGSTYRVKGFSRMADAVAYVYQTRCSQFCNEMGVEFPSSWEEFSSFSRDNASELEMLHEANLYETIERGENG